MAIDVRVIGTADFIRTRADGGLDIEASKEILRRTASEIKKTSIYRVLIDTREASANLSTADMYELATVFAHDPELAHARISVLTRHERIDNVRFMALVSNNRGAHTRAHDQFEEAIDWLMVQMQPAASAA